MDYVIDRVNTVGTVWLGLEYFCNEGDDLWRMGDEEFKAFAVAELAVSVPKSGGEYVFARRAFGEHPQLWRVWGREAAPTGAIARRTILQRCGRPE